MNRLQLQYPIEVLTRTIGVSRSGIYARQGRPPSIRTRTDAVFRTLILQAHKAGRITYGSPRIQLELAEQEVYVGRDRIHRLRKELRLRCIQIKKYNATTNSAHDLPLAPNRLDQKFEVEGPGKVLGTDITSFPPLVQQCLFDLLGVSGLDVHDDCVTALPGHPTLRSHSGLGWNSPSVD